MAEPCSMAGGVDSVEGERAEGGGVGAEPRVSPENADVLGQPGISRWHWPTAGGFGFAEGWSSSTTRS